MLNEHAMYEPEGSRFSCMRIRAIPRNRSPVPIVVFLGDFGGLASYRVGGMENRNDPPPGRISGDWLDDADLSRGRHSSALSVEDLERESVAEAGDAGDRALQSRRSSRASSFLVGPDGTLEDEEVPSTSKDTLSNIYESGSPVWEIKSLVSIDRTSQPNESKQVEKMLPKILEDVSCLVYLSVFAILGVLTRYLLQKLFGPSVAGVTGSEAILYLDLPSNMVGSFLMGWFGVVFKPDISHFSEYLAIGLTTGYLGSLTTFSGWNQGMLNLSVEGKWVFTVLGFIIGLFLTSYSIIFGVETANGFRWLLQINSRDDGRNRTVNSRSVRMMLLVLMLLVLGSLWVASVVILTEEFSRGGRAAKLWLACLVGPPGAWMRWYLAKLNGCGFGKNGRLKWLPIGTLIANVFAACVMAALSTVTKAVNDKNCVTVANGIEFGFCGCLSTVSTFMAEFNAMRESKQPWRAYVYAAVTICVSLGLGILIFDLPVWLKGYNR